MIYEIKTFVSKRDLSDIFISMFFIVMSITSFVDKNIGSGLLLMTYVVLNVIINKQADDIQELKELVEDIEHGN